MTIGAKPRILLVDDEPHLVELYGEMLHKHLSSLPEVKTATSGSRALALLESESFNLLIADLNMPKMDGLQVLSIARRKYPQMRLVVLTAIRDEQFRTRAYAMGIDQYWIKPESDHEVGLFLESMETLIQAEGHSGFRGMQSKSLVDIIQLECLSRSTSILRISNGRTEGRIWIQQGEVVDAEAPGLTGEAAFQRIVSWRTGSFEILPGDAARPRTIHTSYQGLLLDTAQALDEATGAQVEHDGQGKPEASVRVSGTRLLLEELSQINGVEFIVVAEKGRNRHHEAWGLDRPGPVADWTRETMEEFRALGDTLGVGQLQQVLGSGTQRKVALAAAGQSEMCIGFAPASPPDRIQQTTNQIVAKWVS